MTYESKKLIFIVAVIALAVMLVSTAYAQTVNPDDVVVIVPDDIDTWSELVAFWLPKAINAALAVIGTVLLVAIKRGVALLPDFIEAYIDSKRQRDLHSAIMSKVAELIKEGRWPTPLDFKETANNLGSALQPNVVEEIRTYVNEYSPQAAKWAEVVLPNNRANELIRTLSARMATELQAKKQ